MSEERRRCVVEVPYYKLAALLHLPEGSTILHVSAEGEKECIRLMIAHPDAPVWRQGEQARIVTVVSKWDWD